MGRRLHEFAAAPLRLVGDLLASRELLLNLAAKEIRIRYKQSLLGILWAVFVPVSLMLVFTFVFGRLAPVRIDGTSAGGGEIPYALFAYCGLLPWTFFAQSLSGSVTTLVTNRQLVTKVYFPRQVFPVAKILGGLVDFLIAAVVLAGLLVWFRIPVRWTVALVPAVLAVQLVFMTGCALLLSMANLFYRDVQYVFQVGIQLWMFATAVVYPIRPDAFGPVTLWILRLNPMTPILDAYRDLTLYGRLPDLSGAAPAIVVTIAVLWIGAWSFSRLQFLFAERV